MTTTVAPLNDVQTLIVIGNGMVGHHCVEQLIAAGALERYRIHVFGEEGQRAYDRVHLMELDRLDLAFAQREMFESAVAMGKAALKVVGIEADEVERVDREYRSRDCERLERQSRTGDLHAGIDRSFAPDRPLLDEDGDGIEDTRPKPA